ncbi:hypothetical protein N7462_005220 [Penicillium macrosclerotiorum]|uniref:uncharacterized protein n=1 Tax=Penicillium macrosclerotiorum TaxID=303699 RepID=UPI002549AE6D|nr:uncharacterized protein N7462_005220 [Penicillium macrosclerotiorum]KAJ5690828.1 hypothetical protein N7462_005220 [Penicillium macrosclerotiorum]
MESETKDHVEIPIIDTDEPLLSVIPKLSHFISTAIGDIAFSFEQMRHESRGHRLRQLVHALAEDSHNPFIIIALMILKWEFSNAAEDDWGLNESRGYACEFVAWQFLCHLNQHETIEFLLEELPNPRRNSANPFETGYNSGYSSSGDRESAPLLPGDSISSRNSDLGKQSSLNRIGFGYSSIQTAQPQDYDLSRYSRFAGLNALEVAGIAKAMRFLSQKVVQRVVNDIWRGEIVFWDSLTVHSTKKPHIFNRKTADPYSRLRVPLYRKMFEAGFFLSFLFLYYAVLVERKETGIGFFEAFLDVWIAAFAYDELSGIVDAGVLFYQMDFWSLWNMGIIGVGFAFIIASKLNNPPGLKFCLAMIEPLRVKRNEKADGRQSGVIGLAKSDSMILDISFDILSLEALFLVPRICSLVSLNSYFGSLIRANVSPDQIPVLKEMTKAFFRFLPVVVVLYIGFLTTFTMLARDRLSLKEMSWLLVKVFFGYAVKEILLNTPVVACPTIGKMISPIFGYGLMLIFVSMTNILLLSSLISLMSMSLEGVMLHAREEYLFQLSIYVLESSNSRRLTYFMPPLNLIPLLCIRPLRLFLSAGTVRRVRIVLLRATHLPFVMLLWAYESSRRPLRQPTTTCLPPVSTGRSPGTSPRELSRTQCQSPQQPSVVDTYRMGTGPERPRVDHSKVGESSLAPPGEQIQLIEILNAVEQLRAQMERVATGTTGLATTSQG